MGALDQGAGQIVDIIASLRGGTDLLLVMPERDLLERARLAVTRGSSRGLIPEATLDASWRRLSAVRESLPRPDLRPELVGSHHDLADELARRSVTLVRDDAGLIPIHGPKRVLVLEPEPTNVTPADTTSQYGPGLAETIRQFHRDVTGIVYPHDPDATDISGIIDRARKDDVVIVATVNAPPGQVDLVEGMMATNVPLITVALREPLDLASYPGVDTHVCGYSSHTPSLRALARGLFGEQPFEGRLPVSIPSLYPIGHGL
jgi:beta-N-acetylhexosaminidase